MALPDAQHTLLRPVGYQIGDCGYCKKDGTSQRTPKSRASYYVVSKTLRPDHYQIMMDRGWRRSGTLLYLPDAVRSCCPHYTIRLPVTEFKSSRDQRQALHRWNKFVLGEEFAKQASRHRTRDGKKKSNNTFDLLQTVHEAEAPDMSLHIQPQHEFSVTLEPDDFTNEKFELFADYQHHVHHEPPDEITKSGFERFLCKSPLQRRKDDAGKDLGSFHQCYRLDGRLIAVGVLDLLPHAVSGVYFMYHHDFDKWSMGKLSALREIALAGESGYQNYYMGYYIHGCEKMKYKATYKQQYVLDYEDLKWNALDEQLLSRMDKTKYVSLSRQRPDGRPTAVDEGRMQQRDHAETEQAITGASCYDYESPSEAVNSARSLLDIGMPGVMTKAQLTAAFDCGKVWLYLRRGQLFQAEQLQAWDDGDDDDILDSMSLRGMIAEYCASVGPVLAASAVVDFCQ